MFINFFAGEDGWGYANDSPLEPTKRSNPGYATGFDIDSVVFI